MTDTVKVYHAKDGWRWRRQAGNHEVVAESGEAYERWGACLTAAVRVNGGKLAYTVDRPHPDPLHDEEALD